jgi:hypothetical protein
MGIFYLVNDGWSAFNLSKTYIYIFSNVEIQKFWVSMKSTLKYLSQRNLVMNVEVSSI